MHDESFPAIVYHHLTDLYQNRRAENGFHCESGPDIAC